MTSILIFSGTMGFRHDCISAGVRAVEELARDADVASVATEDGGEFTSGVLDEVDAVVWMQASGTGLLNAAQRNAYEEFTARGGGFAGVHAASDAERDWTLYSQLVGARFRNHPTHLQTGRIRIERPGDRSTQGIPNPWVWNEEWYAFETNPRSTVEVIASIAEDSYSPGDASMGADHPIVWRTSVGASYAWYTSLGHEATAFEDSVFRQHLWGGIASVLSPHKPNSEEI